MTIISALRTYILTYSGMGSNPVWVGFLGKEPTQYAIFPLPGARIVRTDIIGNTEREFPFAIESVEFTADDPKRIANCEFYEALADWFETQTKAGTLPSLGTGKTATAIEALGWGVIFEQSDSGVANYQIQAKLSYEQTA